MTESPENILSLAQQTHRNVTIALVDAEIVNKNAIRTVDSFKQILCAYKSNDSESFKNFYAIVARGYTKAIEAENASSQMLTSIRILHNTTSSALLEVKQAINEKVEFENDVVVVLDNKEDLDQQQEYSSELYYCNCKECIESDKNNFENEYFVLVD